MITKKAYDKRLKKIGIGRNPFRPNLLFDRIYSHPKRNEVLLAAAYARNEQKGFVYEPDRNDCDDYAFNSWTDMRKDLKRSTDYRGAITVGVVWGIWVVRDQKTGKDRREPHMWVMADLGETQMHYNYGELVPDSEIWRFQARRTLMA